MDSWEECVLCYMNWTDFVDILAHSENIIFSRAAELRVKYNFLNIDIKYESMTILTDNVICFFLRGLCVPELMWRVSPSLDIFLYHMRKENKSYCLFKHQQRGVGWLEFSWGNPAVTNAAGNCDNGTASSTLWAWEEILHKFPQVSHQVHNNYGAIQSFNNITETRTEPYRQRRIATDSGRSKRDYAYEQTLGS